jgi:hypothetical protein
MLPDVIPCSHEAVFAGMASNDKDAHAGKAGAQRDYFKCLTSDPGKGMIALARGVRGSTFALAFEECWCV